MDGLRSNAMANADELALIFGTSRAVVTHLARKHGLQREKRLLGKRHHSLINVASFQEVFEDPKRLERHKKWSIVRAFIKEASAIWNFRPFPELTKLEMATYLFIGKFKKETGGLDPTLLQICEGLGLPPSQTAYVGKRIRRIEQSGHIRLVQRTSQRTQYLVTTPRERVPEQLAFLACPHGTLIDLPWYKPGSNGAGK